MFRVIFPTLYIAKLWSKFDIKDLGSEKHFLG